MTPWSIFLASDVIVKTIMVGLVMASVVTWTILFTKCLVLFRERAQLRRSMSQVETIPSLQMLSTAVHFPSSSFNSFLDAAIREVGRFQRGMDVGGAKARLSSILAEQIQQEGHRNRQGMSILATIGATSPFVGLLGTVWGIMNSFIGIAKAQTTNLAVVAPGIAEALLATALGLVAAIPAVVIYNFLTRTIRAHNADLKRAAGLIDRLFSRELDAQNVTNMRP